jgi:hypothetical protein
MDDRPYVIMEERRNPLWGSRGLSLYRGGIPIEITLSLWRNPPIGEQRAVTI